MAMTKAEREAWGRCSDNNARLRRENAEAIASRDKALAECDRLRAVASNLRWHAAYGAAVVSAASQIAAQSTGADDPALAMRVAAASAMGLADESERAWAELATKARGNE
jgi:hypothetical protein